jgi:Kef-type K+ transport system membrane component KefB
MELPESQHLLVQIALVLLASRLLAELAQYLSAPPLIGEICAGILLGPSVLGLVSPNEVLAFLAEIGIILLLFEVGIGTDIERLSRAGPRAAVVALSGFFLPFLFGSTAALYIFDLPLLVSLFIGGTLTATSIGITIRILSDLGRQQEYEGQIVLGAAVIDDLLGVFLLAVLFEFATSGSVSLESTGSIILFVAAFFVLAPVLAKTLSPLIQRYHDSSQLPGMIPVVLVSMVLLFAAVAQDVGAPHLLGGFVAGIALSRRFYLPFAATLNVDEEFSERIDEQMRPIIQLFTPIFFVMVGLSMDLSAIDWSSPFIWTFSILMTVLAIIAKMAGPWLIPESVPMRIAIGIAMVPRGEVGLIFAELGRITGVFDASVYAGVVLVIVYTTLASPFWIKLYYQRFGEHLPRRGMEGSEADN